jgi:hypothetical protein
MLYRHPTFFPLILALLTLGLIGFMVVTFSNRSAGGPGGSSEEAVVNEDEYRLKAKQTMAGFEATYEGADDLERLVFVEDALNALLALRVPAAYKDLHLELAFSLNLIREGLRAKSESRLEGERRLFELLSKEAWLK